MDLSNLAIIDPKDGKPTRVGFKILEDGKRYVSPKNRVNKLINFGIIAKGYG